VQAAGEERPAAPVASLLDDVRAVLAAAGGERMWHADLLAALVELRPEVYDEWDVRRLGAELRDRGVPTVQLAGEDTETGERVNRRGLRLVDVTRALEAARQPEIGG
jgi:hypothetical protein